MNLSAKVDGEITEKEVRALFELWNSALATGDSRIVASRYIKVCCIIIFWRVEHKSSDVQNILTVYISHALTSFNSIDYILQSPVLLPTVSDEPRTDFESVKDYFDAFLLKKPQGKILDGKINIGDGWASDTGIYEVSFINHMIQSDHNIVCSYDMLTHMYHCNILFLQFTMGATGDKVKARYTYNYVKEDGIWKIQHHHSSV